MFKGATDHMAQVLERGVRVLYYVVSQAILFRQFRNVDC